MKTITLALLLSLITATGFAQLKFFTNNGKTEIKQGKCGLSDLMVKVPIPETAANYDKLRFFVFLTPNRETNSQAIYECHLEKDMFKGKKEVQIVLKSSDGTNDFYYGRYSFDWGNTFGSPNSLDIDKPCSNPERVDQIYNISFELQGQKFQKKQDVGQSNIDIQPIYQSVILKKWPNAFPMDYGVVDFNSMSTDKSFSISKTYDVSAEIQHYDEETVISVGSAILGTFKSIPASQHSIEDVKADIILTLKKRTLYKYEDPKLSWNIDLCYPCYAKKVKKGDHADLNTQLKEICTAPADWKPAKLSGLDGFILDIPKTLDFQNWSAEDSKPRVSEGDDIPWRKFMAFAVESKGKVFVGVIEYRKGNQAGEEIIAKFFNDVVASFKVY
jgi:hypothetical protein